jgi:hypothetical protein
MPYRATSVAESTASVRPVPRMPGPAPWTPASSPAVAVPRPGGARVPPGLGTPAEVLAIQRTVGNRAVAALLGAAVQRQAGAPALEDEEERQEPARLAAAPVQRETAAAAPSPAPPNRTGLPDAVKSGVETLSGMSLDDVRVHYNSSAPAEVGALAYARGTDIHVAPGQEKHVAHEAWHVVQQKQGRVGATLDVRGTAVNDDPGLEREADVMGRRAAG